MPFFSPLRYPGGKGKLAPFVKEIFKHNNLCDGTYVEPYAGGAAVALALLLEGYAWDIIINDLDPLVHAFWWAVLSDTDNLCSKIETTPVTMDVWHEQKAIHNNPEAFSQAEIGFATFFLNRTNRSGILKAGVIGGKKQNGNYTIAARYNKKDLISRIKLISQYKGRISLHNTDAFDLIKSISPTLSHKSLIYFDPPYFIKGKLLYRNSYSSSDHAKIAGLIKTLTTPWLVTYDNVPEIRALYTESDHAEFDIAYSAHLARPRGAEVMFFNNLKLHTKPYARKASKLDQTA